MQAFNVNEFNSIEFWIKSNVNDANLQKFQKTFKDVFSKTLNSQNFFSISSLFISVIYLFHFTFHFV